MNQACSLPPIYRTLPVKGKPCLTHKFDFGNDPSAGSPTETLLRLLLPLNDQVRPSFVTHLTANRGLLARGTSEGLTKPFNR